MDFTSLLETYYSSPNNTKNPISKKDLIKKIPGIIYHRTIIGDEIFSIPKTSNFINVPPKLRLTTICVITISTRRKKKITIDLFVSEIIYCNSKLFRKHFYHAGILMESSNLDDCIYAITEMEIVWPERTDKFNDELPKFKFNSSVPNEFRDSFLYKDIKHKYDVDELVKYIDGLPCLLAPFEDKPDWVPQNGIYWADIND